MWTFDKWSQRRWLVPAIVLELFCLCSSHAQQRPPYFEVEPGWPKPLPNLWVTGAIGGVCVDSRDHVFVLNRRDLTDNELDAAHQAPPVMEFDSEGNLLNSFGDPEIVPNVLHGCSVDHNGDIWMGGSRDGIVQKYNHDGSKLLLQIGKRGLVDSSDGTLKGTPLNSSRTGFFASAGIAVDPVNGDIYVADGESQSSNHRVAVFDRNGQFLRQWEPHRGEGESGEMFVPVVHCIAMSKDGLVYICDRRARRLQVFDKQGNFQKNIPITFEPQNHYPIGPEHKPGASGTAVWVAFSPDPSQKFLYVTNQDNERIEIVDRQSGQVLSRFGRAGHQLGEFTYVHFAALDSKGNAYVGEINGRRVQKFKVAGSH